MAFLSLLHRHIFLCIHRIGLEEFGCKRETAFSQGLYFLSLVERLAKAETSMFGTLLHMWDEALPV
jgi:hypothetical protein